MMEPHVVRSCMGVPHHYLRHATSFCSKRIADRFNEAEWRHLVNFVRNNKHYEPYLETLKAELKEVNEEMPHLEPARLINGADRSRTEYFRAFTQRLTKFQIASLMRDMFIFTFPIHRDIIIAHELGKRPLNQKRVRTLRRKTQTTTVGYIINHFYNDISPMSAEVFWAIKGCLTYTQDHDFFDNYFILLYDDAVTPFNIKPEHKTKTVMDMAKTIKWKEDWGTCMILADALEDADYRDEEGLRRLREYGVKSQASSLFRELGL